MNAVHSSRPPNRNRGGTRMNAMRILVARLILLVWSPPVFAGARLYQRPVAESTGLRGIRTQPTSRTTGARLGSGAAGSGIPATSSVPGTVATDAFFGITQWKGSAGNVRGRLSLPTAIPDALGYLARSVDVLADNPAWPVKCWQDARACVWAWREHLDAPSYAPRRCAGRPPLATDFDGDGRSDATVFRPSTGLWYTPVCERQRPRPAVGRCIGRPGVQRTTMATARRTSPSFDRGLGNGFRSYPVRITPIRDIIRWGTVATFPCPPTTMAMESTTSRFTGHRTGTWYLTFSTNGTAGAAAWGNSADIPVPGDYDGDGTADIAVFRPSTGTWHLRFSSTGAPVAVTWGNEADVPISGDFDGDGALDIAIYRPVEGAWYVRHSSTGQGRLFLFGNSADIPVPADYDGDGVTDLAVFRPSTGTWHISFTGTGATVAVQWGNEADRPVQDRSMQRK